MLGNQSHIPLVYLFKHQDLNTSVYQFVVIFLCILSCQEMDKKSEEYDRLLDYVKNTHASTHNQYDLNVQEVCALTI